MTLEHNLDQLDSWLQTSIASLTPQAQNQLLRKIGRELRKETVRRMRAQQNPDGSQWTPRKPVRGSIGGSGRPRGRRNPNPQRGNPELKFRYDGASVHLKSYEDEGNTLLGFDLVSRSIKRYRKDRINKGQKRASPMMRKLRNPSRLRQQITRGELRLGWSGQNGYIAQIHHYGLRQKMRFGSAQYPARELIGITAQDKVHIRNLIIDFLGNPP